MSIERKAKNINVDKEVNMKRKLSTLFLVALLVSCGGGAKKISDAEALSIVEGWTVDKALAAGYTKAIYSRTYVGDDRSAEKQEYIGDELSSLISYQVTSNSQFVGGVASGAWAAQPDVWSFQLDNKDLLMHTEETNYYIGDYVFNEFGLLVKSTEKNPAGSESISTTVEWIK